MLLLARGFEKNTQSSLCFACTHIHTLPCSPHRYTRKHTNAGGTEESSVPICCAPGPLSGGSQTGIKPCLDWHWSMHKHSGACSHSTVCVCVCVFIFLQSQETNAEKLGACEKNTAAVFTQGKWNTSNMCVWLWFTLKSQRGWLHFDSFTRLLLLFVFCKYRNAETNTVT